MIDVEGKIKESSLIEKAAEEGDVQWQMKNNANLHVIQKQREESICRCFAYCLNMTNKGKSIPFLTSQENIFKKKLTAQKKSSQLFF